MTDMSNERIHEAHSAMTREMLDADETHFHYKQGHDERCYICTLLESNELLRQALREVRAKQPEMVETYRKYGIVFDDIGIDPKNWQHVAFSTYTQLCEIESICGAALERDD